MNNKTMSNYFKRKKDHYFELVKKDYNHIPKNEEMEALDKLKKHFFNYFFHYGIFSLVLSYFISPLLKYANPIALSIAGAFLGSSIISSYKAIVISTVSPFVSKKRAFIWSFVHLLIFAILSLFILLSCTQAATEHEEYCFNLQKKVESGYETEKNSTIFNNMSCRIQPMN
ncbi:MAG: hypothetical protein LKK36_19955 [Ewingella americana]|uniref:hypothetical protein n=1 Tax=Ewingella americana TaxID=41202 RepID=UPI00242C129C|nr:hypothetical protein [Ewingella americana]MCI1680632.1 hypothetical protein [Ewingella americana]MCI1856439.1 hypothetical protein [Ewingella americana]MCI1864045.1 hypothetical protein [Ewingella americana]MCI2144200.1 hypothetical protein [Ewingella americana]MCI2165951.1 hypothetical protein [Ewingella americana]